MVIEMLEKLMMKTQFAEEEIITKVLFKLLGRHPLPEDWLNFEMLEKIDEPHSYFLIYNNEKIGIVQKQVSEKNLVWTLTVTFNPISDLN